MLEIVKSLPNIATGPANIPLNLAELIVFPLCHIINMSITKGVFPEKLKL